jgi:pyrimidine operon attenuation protein/uracil phosphoribosyltransferase
MATQVIEILSAEEIRRTLTRLASQLIEKSGDLSELVLLGIYTRGVPLAHLVAQQVEMLEQIKVPVGAIDVTFYRDDLDRIKTRTPAKTKIPINLTGKRVVLVDDVIYKGRTIRAALNAVTEYVDHHQGGRLTESRKNRSDEGVSIEAEARFERAILGTGARMKQQAMDLLLN